MAFSSFRLLSVLIPRGQRSKWVIVAVLGIALALAESVAAISIAVLVDAIAGEGDPPMHLPALGNVFDWLPGGTYQEQLYFLVGGMGLYFLLKALLALLHSYAEARVAETTGARIGSRLFSGYLKMPYLFHVRHNSSELIRNSSWATDEVVRNFLRPIAVIFTQLAMLVFLTSVLVLSAPRATLVTFGVLAPLTWVVVRLVKPGLQRLGAETNFAMQLSLRSLQQSLHGIRDVKLLRREEFFRREYRSTRFALARTKYLYPALSEIPRLTVETLLVLGILSFLALAGEVGDQGSLALLGMFAYAGLRIMPAISAIIAAVNYIRYGTSVAETIVEDLLMVEAAAAPASAPNDALQFHDRIEFSNVDFGYEQGQPVLTDINFVIRCGETIGIVGATGAGKSTLLDLLLGLLAPSNGSITVDGRDLKDVLGGWHKIIGLVPQSIYLLDDTIRRNIAYGLADGDIIEEEVHEAIAQARIARFIESLPEGLDTVVGEQGVRLSGGQRQRIAIARGLYRRPQLLVLDEGTASLDTVTEAEVMSSIEPLKRQLTIIMVAHRLSTVRRCDRILLISDGRVADQGTFEELQQRNLEFRTMTG